MAFSMNNGSGLGGRRGRRAAVGTLAEINIVPLVDVVLVLLIIFMLTAHVMEFGMEVNVPKTKTAPKDTVEVLPVVNVSRTGDLFLVDKPVKLIELGAAIDQKFGKSKGAYVRADKDASWETLAHVISALHEAQIPVRLVTQPEENLGARKR